MKTKIAHSEYLQLVGLLTLAERHTRTLRELRDAACELLAIGRDDEEGGEVDDAVWFGDHDPDLLLRKLNVEVSAR